MSESYWEKRFKAIEEKSFEEAEKCIKESVKYIDDAVRDINKEILFWLNRFAKNNNISLAEAKKLITLKDLEELGWDVSKYIAKGSNNKTGEYTQELENASASHHITRLEAIKQQMNEKCEKGFGNVEKSLSSTLLKVYEDIYYKTAYEVQKKVGIGFSFTQVDEKKLKTILEKPWASDGSNFSDRIWKSYKPKLVNNMQKKLVDWCINGTDVQKLTDNLAKESDVVEKACATLIHTEVSNICNQSQVDSYKEMGVEKYKNLETLDGITCKVCGGHDGEVHDIDEFQVGLTAPPFHPRCRGTTIPVTDNLLSKNRQRAARDPETGKTVYVNEMTYEEWKENFVNEKGQQAWDYYEKSVKNKATDKEQYKEYKVVLGKNAPRTLEEFQKLKYTDSEGISKIKAKAQEELTKMDFENMSSFIGTLSNRQTRLWYKYHDENIPNVIDKTKSIEEQAREACELRNTYRSQARDLMKDQEERKRLDRDYPNRTFEELLEHKIQDKGLSREQAIEDIYNTATKTNSSVNKLLGLE